MDLLRNSYPGPWGTVPGVFQEQEASVAEARAVRESEIRAETGSQIRSI